MPNPESPWRQERPDAEGWWWIWQGSDGHWSTPEPKYFVRAKSEVEQWAGDFLSYGPGAPFVGWGDDCLCAPMKGPPPGWES